MGDLAENLEQDRRIVLERAIEYGQMMVRNAIILNAGALVLLPTLMQVFEVKNVYLHRDFWVFAAGLVCALVSLGLSFWAGFEVMGNLDRTIAKIKQDPAQEDELGKPEQKTRIRIYYGRINLWAMAFGVFALVLFSLGVGIAGLTILLASQ